MALTFVTYMGNICIYGPKSSKHHIIYGRSVRSATEYGDGYNTNWPMGAAQGVCATFREESPMCDHVECILHVHLQKNNAIIMLELL